jgi:hypothetical protein
MLKFVSNKLALISVRKKFEIKSLPIPPTGADNKMLFFFKFVDTSTGMANPNLTAQYVPLLALLLCCADTPAPRSPAARRVTATRSLTGVSTPESAADSSPLSAASELTADASANITCYYHIIKANRNGVWIPDPAPGSGWNRTFFVGSGTGSGNFPPPPDPDPHPAYYKDRLRIRSKIDCIHQH